MKTLFKSLTVVLASTVILFSCGKEQNLEPISSVNQVTFVKPTANTESPFLNESLKNAGSDNILAVGCEVYSLVLAGFSGTPHFAGLDSYLVNVDMNTGNSTAASQIKIGVTPVKTVTGITKIPANIPTLYGVTGINSNAPGRLLKINPATGATAIVGLTKKLNNVPVFLQDIEYCTANNRFYAIEEATNRIYWSPNGLNWMPFAAVPPSYQLNGLTFRNAGGITSLWVISGAGNVFCGGNLGDMWEFTLAGVLIGTKNYNATNVLWTNKELGLDYNSSTVCAVRNFVVGSASGFLSNNMTLCPGVPALIGAGQIKPTYDYAKK
jgi:hypothetical protein